MSEEYSEYTQEILDNYPQLLFENYCIIASSALLFFDSALTFPDEYRRIWKRKFTGATLVYLLMRYATVIQRILSVLEILLWNISDQTCGAITRTDDVSLFINYFSVSAFTALRVYGVWGRDWKPLLIILPLSLIRPFITTYENAHYTTVQAGRPLGCVYVYHFSKTTLSNISIISQSTTVVADSILIVLTWIKTFGIHRASTKMGFRTPLATLLLRDGTAYFLVLLIIQTMTILSHWIGQPLAIWIVWLYFDQVLTVVFFSRFMLDLRGIYFNAGHDGETTTLHFSEVKFQGFSSTIVGNLGATLNTCTNIPIPAPACARTGTEDDEGLPATASDSLEDIYAGEWRDDVVEFSDDPFKAGLQSPEEPSALVAVGEAGETARDGAEIDET